MKLSIKVIYTDLTRPFVHTCQGWPHRRHHPNHPCLAVTRAVWTMAAAALVGCVGCAVTRAVWTLAAAALVGCVGRAVTRAVWTLAAAALVGCVGFAAAAAAVCVCRTAVSLRHWYTKLKTR
jgi:hypothetical protein